MLKDRKSFIPGCSVARCPVDRFKQTRGAKVESATLAIPEGFIALFKLGEPKVHHFCVGVENFSIDAALEKLKSDVPESKPITYRREELYFRDPDGILGQISAMDYRGQRTTP